VTGQRGGGPRVLLAPVEVAGQLGLSVAGLRAIGVDARAFARVHPFDYPERPDVVPGPGRISWARNAVRALRGRDIVHFLFGQTFLPEAARQADARLMRRRGIRVVVEFCGSDVRMPGVEAARNPHYVPFPTEDDANATRRMASWATVTDGHVIVPEPGLLAFVGRHFTHAHLVPLRVDTHAFRPAPPSTESGRRPIIAHAPSHLEGKGTVHVRRAVDDLRAAGADFEYLEIAGVPQRAVHAAFARADIVVDQLCVGSYGVAAVEAMSFAKPVVCYIEPAITDSFPPGLPIVHAAPTTLPAVLGALLERPAERRDLGVASRDYAERVHDMRVVAQRLLQVYEALP
jgi:glycosyltransferase involved in cell wall biosynthesis